jgi:hypothetical protein
MLELMLLLLKRLLPQSLLRVKTLTCGTLMMLTLI